MYITQFHNTVQWISLYKRSQYTLCCHNIQAGIKFPVGFSSFVVHENAICQIQHVWGLRGKKKKKKHCSIYMTLWQPESCFSCMLLMILGYFTVLNLCSFCDGAEQWVCPGLFPVLVVFQHTFVHPFSEWDGFVLERVLISCAQPSPHLCAVCPPSDWTPPFRRTDSHQSTDSLH